MDPITFCIVIPISVPNRTCNTHKNREENICKIFLPKFQVQVSHLLKFIGYLVFDGYLAAKDSSDSSFNKHSRGVA